MIVTDTPQGQRLNEALASAIERAVDEEVPFIEMMICVACAVAHLEALAQDSGAEDAHRFTEAFRVICAQASSRMTKMREEGIGHA